MTIIQHNVKICQRYLIRVILFVIDLYENWTIFVTSLCIFDTKLILLLIAHIVIFFFAKQQCVFEQLLLFFNFTPSN